MKRVAFYLATRLPNGRLQDGEHFDTLEEAIEAAQQREGVTFISDGPIGKPETRTVVTIGQE